MQILKYQGNLMFMPKKHKLQWSCGFHRVCYTNEDMDEAIKSSLTLQLDFSVGQSHPSCLERRWWRSSLPQSTALMADKSALPTHSSMAQNPSAKELQAKGNCQHVNISVTYRTGGLPSACRTGRVSKELEIHMQRDSKKMVGTSPMMLIMRKFPKKLMGSQSHIYWPLSLHLLIYAPLYAIKSSILLEKNGKCPLWTSH